MFALPKISFLYATCRKDSQLVWFIDSLNTQVIEYGFPKENIQIVIVDFHLQFDDGAGAERRKEIEKIIDGRFEFVHIAPSPSVYQGKHRVTSKDYFCASIPRNTGVLYIKHPYVVIVDDLSVMLPGSFHHLVDYARRDLTVAFAYKKVFDLEVQPITGNILKVRETLGGTDCRWNQDDGSLFREISGGQFYGYGAYPLDVFLKVNGYDEICNANGAEDYHFGIRVQKTGVKIYYSRLVVFYESEECASTAFAKRDPLFTHEEYYNLMRKYQVTHRYQENGRLDMSHFVLDLLTRDKYWTEGNNYDLSYLRKCGVQFLPQQPDEIKYKSFDGLFLYDL